MTERTQCLRCGGSMTCIGQEKLQMGQYGLLLGNLGQLFSGSLRVAIWCCEDCKKLEFYAADETDDAGDASEERIAQTACPYCGTPHDLDDPKCPHCGRRLMD